VIEHPPPAMIVTVLPLVPEVVHTEVVVEVKLTAKPELAVALTVNGAAPKVTALKALKVMLWVATPVRPKGLKTASKVRAAVPAVA